MVGHGPVSAPFLEAFRRWCQLCGGLGLSFILINTVLNLADAGDKELEAVFAGGVSKLTYIWPFVSFSTAFGINLFTILTEDEPTKISIALVAVYINGMAALSDGLSILGRHTLRRTCWDTAISVDRVIMWMYTTPAMLYLMSIVSDFTKKQVHRLMLIDACMIACALVGYLVPRRDVSGAFFALSLACFVYVTACIYQMFESAIVSARSSSGRNSLLLLRAFTLTLWTSFPLTWAGTMVGFITSIQLQEALWCTLDFFGKFYLRDRIQVVLEIKDLEERKERFLSSITHELRTPLNGIIGLSDGMLANGQVADAGKRTMGIIKSSGLRLLSLINDILDSASLKMGKLTVKKEKVDLRKVVEDVLELTQPLVRKAVQLRNEVPEDIPPVFGDPGRIMQILHNLVGNSCKFTESGFIAVRASPQPHSGMVEVEVVDTGLGIPPKKHLSIFEPFEQVDKETTRKYGGTGLGLNLVKQLVESHGGHIWVKSSLGQGSVFTFTLKVFDEAAARRPKPRKERSKGAAFLAGAYQATRFGPPQVPGTTTSTSNSPPPAGSKRVLAQSADGTPPPNTVSKMLEDLAVASASCVAAPSAARTSALSNKSDSLDKLMMDSGGGDGGSSDLLHSGSLLATDDSNFLMDSQTEAIRVAAAATVAASQELEVMRKKYEAQVHANALLEKQLQEMEEEINRLQDVVDASDEPKKAK